MFAPDQAYSASINGSFCYPFGISIDQNDNVFVADTYNSRIQKLDSSGTYISQWGGAGSADGNFSRPYGNAVDTSGNVYVADTINNRIQKFDSNGNFITKWGTFGVGNGQFNVPVGVALDSANNVFVVDAFNYRIQKFDSNGTFIAKWGQEGNGDGEFEYPTAIDVDATGNVYIVDTGNSRIQKFDSNGTFIAKWGSPNGNGGNANNELNYPYGITVDENGNVYVSDTNNNRIQKFTSAGSYISTYNATGRTTAYPLFLNAGIYSAGNGRLYVGSAYSALLTLCDNEESSNGCLSGTSTPNTITIPNAINSKPVTLSQTGCGSITNSSSQTVASLTKQDGSNTFPVGLVSYTLAGCSNGGSSTVTATFAGLTNTDGLKLRKYNSVTQKYMDVTGTVLSTTTLSGQPAVKAVYSLTDGGPLDQDGQANGTIVDPVGLALTPTSSGALQNTGVVTISIAILLFVLTVSVIYIYRDYRKHKKPLQEIDPKVRYSFGHHIKVVTFPLMRYRIQFSVQKVIPGKNIHKF